MADQKDSKANDTIFDRLDRFLSVPNVSETAVTMKRIDEQRRELADDTKVYEADQQKVLDDEKYYEAQYQAAYEEFKQKQDTWWARRDLLEREKSRLYDTKRRLAARQESLDNQQKAPFLTPEEIRERNVNGRKRNRKAAKRGCFECCAKLTQDDLHRDLCGHGLATLCLKYNHSIRLCLLCFDKRYAELKAQKALRFN